MQVNLSIEMLEVLLHATTKTVELGWATSVKHPLCDYVTTTEDAVFMLEGFLKEARY